MRNARLYLLHVAVCSLVFTGCSGSTRPLATPSGQSSSFYDQQTCLDWKTVPDQQKEALFVPYWKKTIAMTGNLGPHQALLQTLVFKEMDEICGMPRNGQIRLLTAFSQAAKNVAKAGKQNRGGTGEPKIDAQQPTTKVEAQQQLTAGAEQRGAAIKRLSTAEITRGARPWALT